MKYLLLLLVLTGCSDAFIGSIASLGEKRSIRCYSGGVLVYEGTTTDKIENEKGSDGYYFTTINGEYIKISADCIFRRYK